MNSMTTSLTTMPWGMIGVYIQRGLETCPHPKLWRETRLAIVDVVSEGSDSNEFDAGRGSDAGVEELDELISITGTFGTMGSKGGKSEDIAQNPAEDSTLIRAQALAWAQTRARAHILARQVKAAGTPEGQQV